MKTLLKLKDNEYPFNGYNNIRKVARAFVFNDKGEFAFNHLFNDDMFGHRDYFETPGGGVQSNETPSEAVIREIKEEVGADAVIIKELGKVKDFYNLINRKNINYFYLCKVTKMGEKKLEEYETKLIENVHWVKLEDAIKYYESMDKEPISRLVMNRELPILRLIFNKYLDLIK